MTKIPIITQSYFALVEKVAHKSMPQYHGTHPVRFQGPVSVTFPGYLDSEWRSLHHINLSQHEEERERDEDQHVLNTGDLVRIIT